MDARDRAARDREARDMKTRDMKARQYYVCLIPMPYATMKAVPSLISIE